MPAINYDQVASLLNMPDLTPSALRGLLSEKGIKSQAAANAWAQKNAAPTQGSFWSRGFGGLERSWNEAQSKDPIANLLHISHVGSTPAPAKKDPKSAEPSQTQAQKEAALQKQVASSPWTVMGDYLAQQYQGAASAAQNLMQPYQAGGAYSQAAGQATQNALALTGLGAGSGGAGWLAQQEAAANAVTAPTAQAMGQEAGVYAKEAGPISQAISAYGQANALGEITAPEQSWLNALASHVTSNLSYYGEVPTADEPTFQNNPGLGAELALSGGYGGAGGAGLTSVASLPGVPKTVSGSAAQVLSGTGAIGSVPVAGTTPSS